MLLGNGSRNGPKRQKAKHPREPVGLSGIPMLFCSLVDSAALADKEKLPGARRASRDLIEQLAATAKRRVTVVWTKDDIEVPEHAIRAINSSCNRYLPNTKIIRTSVDEPKR